MADSADKVAYYRIDLAGNARQFAGEASSDMKALADKINGATQYVKQLVDAQRSLKGSTEEIKAARDKLGSAIDSELKQIGRANRLLLDNGTNLRKINDDSKAAALAAEKLAKSQETVAKKQLADSVGKSSEAIGLMDNKIVALVARLALGREHVGLFNRGTVALGVAATLASVAVYELSKAIAESSVALISWIAKTSSITYAQQNAREAFAGSAQNAKNWGEQVADLSSKIALPTDQINKLSIAMARTRLEGSTAVDTFNAIGQATAAAGEDVGNLVKDLLTRGQLWNRFSLRPLELQGTGIMFNDVAANLAKNLGVSLDKAKTALYTNGVKLQDGAKAVRQAIEGQFAQINARKMLELDHLTETWHKHLQTLTSGVDFAKIAEPIGKILGMFDAGTIAGDAFKGIITDIGKALGASFSDAVPFVQELVDSMALAALKIESKYYDLKFAIQDAFGNDVFDKVNLFTDAITALKVAAVLAGVAVAGVAISAAPLVLAGYGVVKAVEMISKAIDALREVNLTQIGASIVDGFVNGIKSRVNAVVDAIGDMGSRIKTAFKDALQIHSPSKVFEAYGENTAEGYAQGISGGSSGAQDAVSSMVSVPTASAKTSSASGGGSVSLSVHINVSAGGGGKEIAAKLSEPSFLSQFTKAVEDLCIGAGVPVQSAVQP